MKKLLTLTLSLLMAFSMCLTVSAEPYYFEVDGQQKETFSDAINAADDNVETEIKLIGEYDGDTLTVPANKRIILNLNGNKLFAEVIKVESGAELTIVDKTASDNSYANGTVYLEHLTGSDYAHIDVSGKFTLSSGYINVYNNHYSEQHYMIYAQAGSTVNINGGKIGGSETPIGVTASDVGATISVTGGTFGKDVSAYLGEGCSIVYETGSGIAGTYKVYNKDTKPTVNKDTVAVVAMNQEARTTLKGKKFVGNSSGDTKDITVDSSTQFFLTSTLEDEFTPEEAALFGNELKKQNLYTDTTNLKYISLDIELKTYDDGKLYSIYELVDKNDGDKYYEIPVTLYLSSETVEELKDKDIKVVREHDTDITEENEFGLSLIEDVTLDVESKTLTFKTGKFSGYYIAYKTSSGSGSSSSTTTTTPTKTYDAKDKNQDGIITCDEEMNSANWVWSTTKGACVYSVTNTSVR